MMSRTHIAVGAAVALALAQDGSPEACVAAVIGGTGGGINADVDITPSRAHKDALVGRLIVVAIAAIALAADYWAGAGVCDYLVAHMGWPLICGILLFAALTFIRSHTEHRSFTHSIVAVAAFCAAVWLACEPLVPYFAAGYASHLLLDITNKRPIRLLFPLHTRVGLGLCDAKGAANSICMVLGIAAAVLLLAYRVAPLLGITIAFQM